ncbi:uncharacterized protein LOC106076788 isoform X4 [Biomphalaria glabrata]|uniref:Uncharacterized protein LOC106076788 isoform X4 n=1 Tax=Biomphalaria glabrata TaxID=6526 RepID=A0A9W2YXH2_BIOGL|nr:uncharacterized protein LOC106076788 isoform X4 [Biomphalaria glabrata]
MIYFFVNRFLCIMFANGSNGFIIVTMIIVFSDSFLLECPPVHENAVATLKAYVNRTINKTHRNAQPVLQFSKNNISVPVPVLSCLLDEDSKCVDEGSNITNMKIINFTKQLTENHYVITLEVLTNTSWTSNSTKFSAFGEWQVKLLKDIKTCDLQVYALDKPQCIKEEFNITCIFNKVFPEAYCFFNIIFNDTYNVTVNATYNSAKINNGPYFKTVCSFWNKYDNETYQVNVTIYPNITDNKRNIYRSYEITVTNTLVTQTPSITDSSIPTEISTQGNTKEMAFVLTTSFVCVLLITVTLIVLSLWMKIKRGYFEEFVYYKCCWGISMHKHKLHQQKVAATDNTEIYSLTLPKSNSLDPYSVVDELKLSGCRTSDVLKIEKKKKNQLKNINIDYVNHKNNTGSSSKHCNEKLTQPKSATAVSESSKSPTKLKRFKVNDGQYTLVDKPMKETQQDIYSNGDIITSSSTLVPLASTINKLPKTLKRFTFNESQYTLIEKSVVSKSIYTSQEGLLNDTDIVDNEDDPVTYASIFAQYK